MKVLFLDVDGVLNCVNTTDRVNGSYYTGLDQDKLDLLKKIVAETDCKIVLSSAWRHFAEFTDYWLDRMGRDYIKDIHIGITPLVGYDNRAEEIQAWIDTHKVDSFVVLDDDHIDSLVRFGERFIQTMYEDGLTPEIAEKAITALGRI
jgi:alkanesulfonate monooxygenase SsuD/methylene tetrahydromethanopterin reductase-like flavin-dependent oxidoreductase (luciferase family)